MLKTYLKDIFISIRKTPANSAINLIGLSVGMAVFLMISVYVISELKVNKDLTNYSRIYRVAKTSTGYQGTPPRLGEVLKTSLPEMSAFSRLTSGGSNHVIKVDDVPHNPGQVVYVDSSFFRIFDLPFKYGDRGSCLETQFSMVISETVSDRLFPGENPVGKIVKLNGKYDAVINGVVHDPGQHSHIEADVFISFQTLPVIYNWPNLYDCFGCYNYQTFVMFSHDIDPLQIEERINQVLVSYNEKNSAQRFYDESFVLVDLHDVYFGMEQSPSFRKGNFMQLKIFSAIAILILAIAVFNYVNLATALSTVRMHQMALRKAIGAGRRNLYIPIIGEAVLISLAALIFGLVIIKFAGPLFNRVLGSDYDINIAGNPWLLFIIILGAIITGLVAGAWPALMIARIDSGRSLRGILGNSSSGNRTRQGLTVFQILVSVVLIGCTAVIYKQLRYISDADLGFDKEALVFMYTNDEITGHSQAFKNELLKHSGIENVSYSYASYRTNNEKWGMDFQDERIQLHMEIVDDNYLETLGLKVIEGRNFRGEQDRGMLIINREAASSFFDENTLGTRLNGPDGTMEIVGVVEDFRFLTFDKMVEPMGMLYRSGGGSLCNVRLSGVDVNGALKHMENTWKQFCVEYPFDYHFVDRLYADRYSKEKNIAGLLGFFSIVSILIAALGIYGLSAFRVMKRAREVGVRKVTGASVTDVIRSLTSDLNMIFLVSVVPSFLLIFIVMSKWLSGFAYHVNIPLVVYPLSAAIVWLIAMLSTMGKTMKTARINPAEILRTE